MSLFGGRKHKTSSSTNGGFDSDIGCGPRGPAAGIGEHPSLSSSAASLLSADIPGNSNYNRDHQVADFRAGKYGSGYALMKKKKSKNVADLSKIPPVRYIES